MSIKKKGGCVFILFLSLLSFNFVFGQQAPFASWLTYLANTRLNSRWLNVTDVGYRTVSDNFTPFQNYIRSGMRYHFDQKRSITIGAAYYNTKTSFIKDNQEYGHEFRFFQDFQRQSSRSNKFLIDVRLRTEERFFSGTSTRDPFFSFRFTGRALAGYQINHSVIYQIGGEWMEAYTNRIFGYDQIRFINILSMRFTPQVSTNLMYMFVRRKAFDQNVFSIMFINNFQIRNKDGK